MRFNLVDIVWALFALSPAGLPHNGIAVAGVKTKPAHQQSDALKEEAHAIVAKIVAGNDIRTAARAITAIENNTSLGALISTFLQKHTGRAHIIGITGVGGAGKSTLTSQIVRSLRRQDEQKKQEEQDQQKKQNWKDRKVGIVAVDPSSPISGGAVLGDRTRMGALIDDHNVFIRSMATRHGVGALSRHATDAVDVLDAMGYDPVIVETVGAGQSEIEIVKLADTVLVVEAPNLGDGLQASKAGLTEIADHFVVNKSDLPGAGTLTLLLKESLEDTNAARAQRTVPLPAIKVFNVVSTGTEDGQNPDIKGIDELVDGVQEHFAQITASGLRAKKREQRRELREQRLVWGVLDTIVERAKHETQNDPRWQELMGKVFAGEMTPDQASAVLLDKP